MERTPTAWARRSPRGYPSPRAPSPSILRGSGRGLAGGAYPKRVDVGGERQTRKTIREYVPGSRPSRHQAAAKKSSAQEIREWKKHNEQKDRTFERSLRKTGGSLGSDRRRLSTSPSRSRRGRSTSPSARSTRISPGLATSPRRRSPSPTQRVVRRTDNATHVGSPIYSSRRHARSPTSSRRTDSPRFSRSPSPQRQVVTYHNSPRVSVRESPQARVFRSRSRSRSTSPRRRETTVRDRTRVVARESSQVLSDTAAPCVRMEADDIVTFVASWKIPRATTASPGGVADPPLDVQLIQFDKEGNQIEGGLLDSKHPHTEWKHPDEDETNPWHVTATHSGDRIADGGGWQEITIELAEVAPNVHSIYVVVKTRNGTTLNHVDPEQFEFSATSASTGGSHRHLPCELPALALARRTDCAVVARLVCTHRHRRLRDITGNIVENVVDGWGCQPLSLMVEPFRGLPQHNTIEKAFQRALDAIQNFLRGEATTLATNRAVGVPASPVRTLTYEAEGRPFSPTRTGSLRPYSTSPASQMARVVDEDGRVFDLGLSTPVRCVGTWQHTKPLDISSLMFGWDNRFLPDTHLDRNRNAIEWCFDEGRPEWITAATHSGDIQGAGNRSGRQELEVYPNDVSHSVQAIFFVLSPGERMHLEQLRGGNAKIWQGPSLLLSFDCGSYVGMATSMVLGAMIRSDSSSPWEFHALEIACFGNEGASSKRRQWESICGEWLGDV